MKYPQAAAQYMDSIHGRALLKMGLIVAPSCNDCHGVHDIKRAWTANRPSTMPMSPRPAANATSASRRPTSRASTASSSPRATSVDRSAPIATPRTRSRPPKNGHFKMASDQRCGKCHEDRLEHYRDTYHGKAMALGKPNVASDVAACYDCHGHHDVLPPSNPASRLSKANILATCQQCHPSATIGFTEYKPHANPLDGKNYPLLHAVFLGMTGLLIGVFAFFGLHTLVWLCPRVLPLPARLEEIPRSQGQDPDRR